MYSTTGTHEAYTAGQGKNIQREAQEPQAWEQRALLRALALRTLQARRRSTTVAGTAHTADTGDM